MFYERLIDEIGKYPCLYDKKHEFYRHKVRKDRAWKEIANAVGEEKPYCQGRWRMLRDRFVKENAKRPASRWNLLKKLNFLKGHAGSRGSKPHQQQQQHAPKNGEGTDESQYFKNEEDDLSFMEYADDDETNPTDQPEESVASYDYKNSSINFEEIQILSSPTQSKFEHSTSSMQEETAATANTPAPSKVNGTKRRREVSDAEQHFVSFVDSVQDMIRSKFNANTQQVPQPSRNADFLRVLDGYMLKLNEEQQDEIKIEILNLVFKRSRELKSNSTLSQKGI